MEAYLRILRVPRMPGLLAAMVLARLPIGINGLALVLFLRAEGRSFAVAGAAAGGLSLGTGLGAPLAARLVDRLGPRALLGLALGHGAALLGLVALGASAAATPAVVALAFAAGAAFPPTSSVLRALFPRLLRADLLRGAFALDSVLTETIFVLGPLVTAALVALVAPAAALVVSAAAVAAGVVAFLAALPGPAAARGRASRAGGRLGALRAPGIRTLVLSMLPVGFAFGAMEVALPAYADGEGHPELAGVLLAIWSVASAVGGLVYGARPRRRALAQVHVRVALAVPLGLLPVALAGSPWTMALLVVPAGLFIAPLIATRNELAGVVAPPGVETEANTWPLTALVGGIALGAAAGGALADGTGWRAAVLVACGAAALGAVVALTRRGTLAGPAPVPEPA